jgi:hypothetical protein
MVHADEMAGQLQVLGLVKGVQQQVDEVKAGE